tara:strand:+ start:172 stop:1197 length:1026 start_codon:yes stop_codon:yes gene_type:complete
MEHKGKTSRINLCEYCIDARKKSIPYGYDNYKEWRIKDKSKPKPIIQDIPIEAILPYLFDSFSKHFSYSFPSPTRASICEMSLKNYLVYLSRCASVSKEWNDYFNDPLFWKPIFKNILVNSFYEKKKKIMMAENTKKIPSSDWTNSEIRSNKCQMVVINETKDIPFDIYWISARGTKNIPGVCDYRSDVSPMSTYRCGTTYPNARWMCIPKKEWLHQNPYSNIGFTWTVNVFDLKTFKKEDHDTLGNGKLSYIVRIKEPNYSKMLSIKDIHKDFPDYRIRIINNLFDKKEISYKWTKERNKRNQTTQIINNLKEEIKKLQSEVSESQEKGNNYLYLMNKIN